ncbi:MAG: 3-hydroxyacyl-CoA dehydrogenase [Hyphomicrobiales bacterium]
MTKTVAIVGCGLIGQAWTISFARAGRQVRLWDAKDNVARTMLNGLPPILEDLNKHGLLGRAAEDVISKITICNTLEEAVSDVDHVQENSPETIDIKRTVFEHLDKLTDRKTILASSSSALLPSNFTEGLKGRERCLVIHPINPPYLVPAVEIVPSKWTSSYAVEHSVELMSEIGQVPITMKKELDGFIMNRLQGALMEEAFRLVDGGYATAEEVDIGIRDGLALRWSFIGPFETIDLNAPGGVRDYAERYNEMYRGIAAKATQRVDWSGNVLNDVEDDRREALPEEQLAERRAWRDLRLMALIAHKKEVKKELGS